MNAPYDTFSKTSMYACAGFFQPSVCRGLMFKWYCISLTSLSVIIPGRLQTIIAPSAKTSCIASEGNFQSRTFLGRLLSCH